MYLFTCNNNLFCHHQNLLNCHCALQKVRHRGTCCCCVNKNTIDPSQSKSMYGPTSTPVLKATQIKMLIVALTEEVPMTSHARESFELETLSTVGLF